MNNLQELVSHGIEKSTAQRMIDGYSKRIGTMNGIYRITDITYDFSNHGRVVTLECTGCGKTIARLMVNGRNKWSELIKTCDCEKERERIRKIEVKKQESNEKKIREATIRIGEIHGDYKILALSGSPDNLKYMVQCTTCGAEKQISARNFETRKDFHCKKHYVQPIKFDDSYIGRKNGHLTVIGFTKDSFGKKAFLCKCDCGKEIAVKPTYWENGDVKSCGCMHDESSIKHGGSKDRLYSVWHGMLRRCYSHSEKAYENYGGRGISVCEEWRHDYAVFKKWAYENGYDENAPFGECTIDRIDVNGNYEPSNCRWISNAEQQKNKRPREQLKDGGYRKFIYVNGQRISRKVACKEAGVQEATFKYRVGVKGMTSEEALKTKIRDNSSVRVRLNDEMREWLFKKSEREKKTVSQLIRDLIERDMKTRS